MVARNTVGISPGIFIGRFAGTHFARPACSRFIALSCDTGQAFGMAPPDHLE